MTAPDTTTRSWAGSSAKIQCVAGSGSNLYAYCGDNPTDATDPSGISPGKAV